MKYEQNRRSSSLIGTSKVYAAYRGTLRAKTSHPAKNGEGGTKIEPGACVEAHQRAAHSALRFKPKAKAALTASPDMTRILVMPDTLPLSSVKTHLSELVDRVEDQHDRVVVTRNGKPAAVLISHEDLESLEETLAILSDPDLMAQIRESERSSAAKEPTTTLAELQAGLKDRHDAAA